MQFLLWYYSSLAITTSVVAGAVWMVFGGFILARLIVVTPLAVLIAFLVITRTN